MTCKKAPRPLSARDSLPRVPFRQLSDSGFPGAHYCGRAILYLSRPVGAALRSPLGPRSPARLALRAGLTSSLKARGVLRLELVDLVQDCTTLEDLEVIVIRCSASSLLAILR